MSLNPASDLALLRQYAAERSQAAFAELVRRHIDFVYAAALRQLNGDTHLARDVAQIVFTDLARRASTLTGHPVLAGWLHTSTRYAAAKLIRTERRRQTRDQEAQLMTELTRDDSAPVNWARLQPLIDDALGQLRPAEREAILLRYFQGHTYAEIGSRLGMTENATRSAVDRGVDKLGGILARRGIASTSTAVAAALAGQVAMAAPADVAASVTAGALASAAAAGSASGAAAVFMSMTKLQLGIAVAIVGAGTAGFVVQQRHVAAMRTAFADLDRQMQQSAAISAENLQLEQARQAAATQTAASKAELANLRRQTADLRTQLQELQLKRAIPAVAPTTQVGTPSATVYPESAVDVQPKPTFRPPPIYPSDLRGLGINGKVTVAFTIATDGRVTDVVTKDATYPAFADSVKEALGHWRFQPGQKDGHAVATRVDMPITFKMVNNATPASTKSPTQAGGVPWF